jgi:hypothetical protein
MMNNHGRKVRVFYANLLHHGIVIKPEGNGLAVTRTKDIEISPVLEAEIRNRAALLMEMLTPVPPAPLAGYFYRLLSETEADRAVLQAQQLGINLDCTQVGASWLVEMGKP